MELIEARSFEELRGLVEREEVDAGLFLDLGAQPQRLELCVTSRAPEETAEAGVRRCPGRSSIPSSGTGSRWISVP
ncbi:MAG: hypothetical protein ACUVRX_07635 [Actinomycetota bacterium]